MTRRLALMAAAALVAPASGCLHGGKGGGADGGGDAGIECYEGDLLIESADDVALIRPHECITGSLTISASGLESLELPNLQSVGGDLRLWSNSDLASLDLSNLVSVGESLSVHGNPALASLAGLAGLVSVGGGLSVSNSPALATLGLASLATVGRSLYVVNAPALEALDLPALTALGWNVTIEGNAALSSLEGLGNLSSVGHLIIRNNPALSDLDGLMGLQEVQGLLRIENNASLASLDGLEGIASVGSAGGGWYVMVWNNPSLSSIDGLSGLQAVGRSFWVRGNAALGDIDGLNSLTSVGWQLIIEDNASLASLAGFGGLTSLGIDLIVRGNPALASIDGFGGLTSVGGGLSIISNPALTEFGLGALTTICHWVIEETNPGEEFACGLLIIDNEALSQCLACELLERLGYDEYYSEWSFEFSGNLADECWYDCVSLPSTMLDCDGGKLDPTTNLCWQHPTSIWVYNQQNSAAYCDELVLGGHDDWRLPNIEEAITLLRGCVDGTATGDQSPSACRMTPAGCVADDSCNGKIDCWFCPYPDGPGPGGCYWDAALGDTCYYSFWTSSTHSGDSDNAWYVGFWSGTVYHSNKTTEAKRPRCVRDGP